jgi:hypothetical protein
MHGGCSVIRNKDLRITLGPCACGTDFSAAVIAIHGQSRFGRVFVERGVVSDAGEQQMAIERDRHIVRKRIHGDGILPQRIGSIKNKRGPVALIKSIGHRFVYSVSGPAVEQAAGLQSRFDPVGRIASACEALLIENSARHCRLRQSNHQHEKCADDRFRAKTNHPNLLLLEDRAAEIFESIGKNSGTVPSFRLFFSA